MKTVNETIQQLTVPTPFAVGDVHVYVIKGDTLSIVDAGVKTEEAWIALKAQLKECGYTPHDIEQVILTHHHPDHIGLTEKFPRAQIIAHKNVDPWLTRDQLYFNHYEQFFSDCLVAFGVPKQVHQPFLNHLHEPLQYAGEGQVTVTINEGDRLPGHHDWQVIDTKGHAQTHVSFLNTSNGTFIGGDHLLHHISSNPLLEPPPPLEKERPKPILQYRANLKKCLQLGIQTVLPGHGKTFSSIELEQLIENRLFKQEKRARDVLTLLQDKPQTPFEICRKIFPQQYKTQLDLTMSETIGQLDFLEDNGYVKKTMIDGTFVYMPRQ
ncbi:MAG TPA: MBL fold metallo-hydrolase [Bacillota bacterium]